MATDCAILFTAAVPSPIQLQAKHAPRVTPPISIKTWRKTDHTRNVYSSTVATRKTTASTLDNLCPYTASAMNRQLWLRQALTALNAETPSQKNRITRKSATQNLESLPKSHWTGSQPQPIPQHDRPLLLLSLIHI